MNGTTKPQSSGFKANGLATSYNQSVNTPQVWNHATGRGVGVAVIDTGIAGGLADFRRGDGSGSRVVASAVTNPDATTAEDTYGHGTHVAGLLAGDSSARGNDDPLRGRTPVAPDASLISIKASDDHGTHRSSTSSTASSSRWSTRMSSTSASSTCRSSPRLPSPTHRSARRRGRGGVVPGLVVVTAAGNRGSDADAVDYAPGNDPYAISVGAVDDHGTKQTKDDLRTDWSSRGTTQDGYAKPDLYAPGAHMVSTSPPTATSPRCARAVCPATASTSGPAAHRCRRPSWPVLWQRSSKSTPDGRPTR